VCLIALAYKVHPQFPFIIAANRDEFSDRPAEPAHFWGDAPHVLAGRDLKAGGTWLGITRTGRFAAITNYRDLRRPMPAGPSRGTLVREALEGSIDPQGTGMYAGFNLIYGPLQALRYHNNIEPADRALAAGIHGLSNHFLDTPWPKVVRATTELQRLIGEPGADLVNDLFALLADEAPAPDDRLPDTGLPLELERAASSIFIRSAGYGTRCSTVLLVDNKGHVRFEERTVPGGRVIEEFEMDNAGVFAP
jgi:uncharacterized protein with NRDE domain